MKVCKENYKILVLEYIFPKCAKCSAASLDSGACKYLGNREKKEHIELGMALVVNR